MTHKRTTKKALFTSAVSLLLCLAMLIGTTLAWFTDSVSSGSNIITSGNLDIDVQYSLDGENWKDLAGATDLFSKGLWEPGHTEVVALKVINKGSLALKYNAAMSIFSETPGVNQAGEEFKLSEYLKVSSMTMDGGAIGDVLASYAFENEDSIWSGVTPVGFGSMALGQEGIILEKGQTSYTILKVDMPETVGNEANHNGTDVPNIEFGINVVATQYAHEFDSFGNQYDKHATFEQLADPSISAVESKMLESGADFIEFAVSTNGFNLAKVTVPASAIADTTAPVTVSFDGMNPADTITMGTNTKAYAFDIKVSNLKEELADDQLVTVVVTAPYALPMMKAYHNGEEIAATYDELAGTITFKTANFSPFAFSYTEKTVSTLDELRTAVVENNVLIKLGANLTVDLGTDTGAVYTAQNSGGDGYYYTKAYKNGVIVSGQNVAVDLNGHKITVTCATDKLGDAGALFFVDPAIVGSSLNIIDQSQAQTGTIEMKASVYMVWANEDPTGDDDGVDKTVTYDVDIYSGKFVADAYAGDPVAPGGENYAENSNRAIIYAGNGGTINVYGGYFLYDNTYNSKVQNSNNGAFNVMTHVTTPCITIHDGVMLSNQYYRQANGTDDDSIKLAKDCEVAEISKSVTIGGETYTTWYEVIANLSSITATAKKGVYDAQHPFTADDFNVYAITENGGSGKITNFTVSVDTANGIATITYTSDSGKTLTTTCSVSQMNLTLLDEDRIKAPISVVTNPNKRPWEKYTYAEAPFFGTGNFSVSGWAHLINGAYTYDYFANNGQNYTAPNGETVTGFNNKLEFTGSGNNRTGKYADGFYGLTINNAKPYTTLGINNVVGCLEDAPQLKGFGVYINDDLSTLKWATPAAVYTEGDMYNHYGWNNGHSVLEINCADFEPGKSYDVHWVLVFDDGLTPMADWKVNMAAASASDAVFTDTEKPNANVIVMAGQSNMFGPAPLTQKIIDTYKNVDFSNVFIKYANINFDVASDGSVLRSLSTVFSNSDFQKYEVGIGAQGNTYFGPELALAYHLATDPAFAGQQWYIVKYAPAGTALGSQWTSNCSIDGKTTTLTNDMLDYVQTAIDSLSDDFDVHVRSFMWMQGESDAATSASASNYGNLEKILVSRVRDTFAAYATRPVGNVAGSGISFIDAGIADNANKLGVAQGGPNDWIYATDVNEGKVSNSQYWCSLPAMAAPNFTPTSGPLAGVQFQANAPSLMNPAGGNIVNSIFIDTSHLLSKAAAHSLDSNHALYEDYGNVSDNTDWAHYSAGSMEALGQLYGSCLQYMIMQNG